jgi:hypothetical protein
MKTKLTIAGLLAFNSLVWLAIFAAVVMSSTGCKKDTCQTCTWKHQQGHSLTVWYTVSQKEVCDPDEIEKLDGKYSWTIDGQGNNVFAKCECE